MYYRTAIVYPDGQESVVAQLPNLKVARKYHKSYEKYVIEQFEKNNVDISCYLRRTEYLRGFPGFYFCSDVFVDSKLFGSVITIRCDESAD